MRSSSGSLRFGCALTIIAALTGCAGNGTGRPPAVDPPAAPAPADQNPLRVALDEARDEERWWAFLGAVRKALAVPDQPLPESLEERLAAAAAEASAWVARLRDAEASGDPGDQVLAQWRATALAVREARRELVVEYASVELSAEGSMVDDLAPGPPVESLAGPETTALLRRSCERARDEQRWWQIARLVCAELADRGDRPPPRNLLRRSVEPSVDVELWLFGDRIAMTTPFESDQERLDFVAKDHDGADEIIDARRRWIREFVESVLGERDPEALRRLDPSL